jgi:hypothetical protein
MKLKHAYFRLQASLGRPGGRGAKATRCVLRCRILGKCVGAAILADKWVSGEIVRGFKSRIRSIIHHEETERVTDNSQGLERNVDPADAIRRMNMVP